MTEFSLLLEGTASILQAVCWPTLVILILFLFKKPLADFFQNLGEFTFKASPSGLEASAKKLEATANLAAATAKQNGEKETDISRPGSVAKSVERLSTRQILKLAGKRLLWVDDNPSNNVYERRALEALGIEIVLSLTTEDALEKVSNHHFDVIVSDMGRPDDDKAGFTLLHKLREMDVKSPYIIYNAWTDSSLRQKAKALSAYGQTNVAEELFQMVLNSLLIIDYLGEQRAFR